MKDGITSLEPGKIASIVTFLEMRKPPSIAASKPLETLSLRKVPDPDLNWYRNVFRATGENWLWFSRLLLDDFSLAATIQSPRVDVFAVEFEGRDGGLLELDRRPFREVEIAFLGLKPELIGRGVGKWLLSEALSISWSHKPDRVTVH